MRTPTLVRTHAKSRRWRLFDWLVELSDHIGFYKPVDLFDDVSVTGYDVAVDGTETDAVVELVKLWQLWRIRPLDPWLRCAFFLCV